MNKWKEFLDSGMLWFINRQLHIFGWVIIVIQDEEGEILEVKPEKTDFRGFTLSSELEGFKKVTRYMKENSLSLFRTVNE